MQLHILTAFARSDAVYLTHEDADPNKLATSRLMADRLAPTRVPVQRGIEAHPPPTVDPATAGSARARLLGAHIGIAFRDAKTDMGQPDVLVEYALRKNGNLVPLPPSANGMLGLLYSECGAVNATLLNPSWPDSPAAIAQINISGHASPMLSVPQTSRYFVVDA